MDGLELYLLSRKLMKIAEEAIPKSRFHQLPTSVRTVMLDVFEHPDSSVNEITERTGFPQSHVSSSVARLREAGALVTSVDPNDRRRTLVRQAPDVPERAARIASTPIDQALAAALGSDDPETTRDVVAALETIARHLKPDHPRRSPV